MEIEFPGSLLKKMLYLHLPCTLDRGGAANQSPQNSSIKKSVPNSNYEKKTLCQVKVCKKMISAPIGG